MTQLVDDIHKLIQISSETQDVQGVTTALAAAAELFPPDFEWEKVQHTGHAPLLIGRRIIADANSTVLLSGHLDTVFPADAIDVVVKENKLFGSGTQDMKGGIAVMAEVARRNTQTSFIVALSPEEELGPANAYVNNLMKIAAEAGYIFVFESTLDSEPKAVATKRSLVVSRKGFYKLKFMISGPGGHSGVLTKKEQRHNCINLAAEIIPALQDAISDYENGTTCNFGKISGGTAYNVLADSVEMICEIRYKDDNEPERFLAAIETICNQADAEPFTVNYEVEVDFPPLPATDHSMRFAHLLQEHAEDDSIIIEQRGGGSEANFFYAGNPEAVILDGFGIRGDHQHTRKEYLRIDSIEPAIDFTCKAIDLAQKSL